MLRKIPIKTLLIVGFIVSGLIPTLAVTYINYKTTRAEMKKQVFRQLESVRNIKKEQIHDFFDERMANISAFSENPTILQAYRDLEAVFGEEGNGFRGYSEGRFEAPRPYLSVHERYFRFFEKLISRYGYYDLFLLDPVYGRVIFTVRKEADFGIRMSDVSSSLRDVWIAASKKKRIGLSDIRPYPPSNNIPAQFMAAPLLEKGDVAGVIAVQISFDSIDEIMKERSGMWQTGETYLVGQDKKMRSDSYLDGSHHSILASFSGTVEKNGVDTVASQRALQGIEGKKIIIDYRDKKVLSAYTPVNIKDLRWALIAEVDEEEIDGQIATALNGKIEILTALSVSALVLLAFTVSAFINKGIKNIVFQLERMIDNIFKGKFHIRANPDSVVTDFRRVVSRTNELLDAFVKQMEEKRRLEDQIHSTQRLEAIGTLAGGIAHDFNNILTSMHAYALIVKKNIGGNRFAEENLNELILSIRRASELVEQILTFSRQVKTDEEFLDISQEISDSIKLFKAALPRNIVVESRLSAEPLFIKANPSQIRQVIMNLYTNAYHAMQKNGGTLTISTARVEREANPASSTKRGTFCKISVKDTGHGMDRKIQRRIFEPFFTTKPVGEGTGMGLSVVHGIVRRCGGDIEVASSPGKGACFDVYLPLARRADSQKREKAQEAAAEPGTGNVLLVDDDGQICDSQKKALNLLGYDVTAMQDSRVALEVFSRNPGQFDLLIVDLNMPYLNGFEFTEKILDIREDTPVILTTGFEEMIDRKKIEELGLCSVLLKPYKLNDIARCIAEILKSGKKKAH
jgi:signal transduction histidine kinase/ActR/RegA family two-component response regulator